MKALVVGGAGYVGAHLCKALARQGVPFVVYDSLATGHRDFVKWSPLVVGDIRDTARLADTMRAHGIDFVFHFAAKAYVGESVVEPDSYYDVNVAGSLSLLRAMQLADVRRIVFSSTCAVYGTPDALPITEATPPRPINPYGKTKLIVEGMLADFARAYGLSYAALRYFNACGADLDGEIGEDHDPEPHLIPRAVLAALGKVPPLTVFGTDYDTPDGTAIRDYIHVDDLAQYHLKACERLNNGADSFIANLGTGRGYSVREIIEAAGQVIGTPVPFTEAARRAGDPAQLVASNARARELLGYTPQVSDLETVFASALRWHQRRHADHAPA